MGFQPKTKKIWLLIFFYINKNSVKKTKTNKYIKKLMRR